MIVIGLTGRAGSGKSTVAERLVCEHDFQALAFADPLWQMLEIIGVDTDRVHVDREYKDHHILPGIGRTPRELIQTLGTEWGRDCIDVDLWAKIGARVASERAGRGRVIVFDDMRFPNEYEALAREGARMWQIVRPDVARPEGEAAHPSEGGLDGFEFHETILNDCSIREFRRRVLDAYERARRG